MNRLSGHIEHIESAGSIALVEVGVHGYRFTAMLAGASGELTRWTPGMPVTLLFKETEVALGKELSGLLSMRNRTPALVTSIERGQLLSKVTLDFHGTAIISIITTRASDALNLTIGDSVEGLVKATEITLLTEQAP